MVCWCCLLLSVSDPARASRVIQLQGLSCNQAHRDGPYIAGEPAPIVELEDQFWLMISLHYITRKRTDPSSATPCATLLKASMLKLSLVSERDIFAHSHVQSLSC